jgi:short-subunit dehydrogenase
METGCDVMAVDLLESSGAEQLFEMAWSRLDGVDVLVNGAGMNQRKVPVAEIEVPDWEAHMALNLRAPMVLCREAMRRMPAGGHILNVVSTIALTSQANYSIYAASKYGLLGFTNTLRKEAQSRGIKVTAAFPGGTDTAFREEERLDYMRPDSAALMLVQALEAPRDVVMHEVVFRPMVETNF